MWHVTYDMRYVTHETWHIFFFSFGGWVSVIKILPCAGFFCIGATMRKPWEVKWSPWCWILSKCWEIPVHDWAIHTDIKYFERCSLHVCHKKFKYHRNILGLFSQHCSMQMVKGENRFACISRCYGLDIKLLRTAEF